VFFCAFCEKNKPGLSFNEKSEQLRYENKKGHDMHGLFMVFIFVLDAEGL